MNGDVIGESIVTSFLTHNVLQKWTLYLIHMFVGSSLKVNELLGYIIF